MAGGGARSMAGSGGRGLHGSARFLQRLRIRHALGIQSKGLMQSFKPMCGRDCRCGTWCDKKLNRISIEGQDFAQDTQEGGADQFELIPDSDEEGPQQSFVAENDEFVLETELQDMPVMKHIGKRGVKKLVAVCVPCSMNGARFCWRVIRHAQARLEPTSKTHAQGTLQASTKRMIRMTPKTITSIRPASLM